MYVKVVGSQDKLVKLGSKDELLYFRVMDAGVYSNSSEKTFYLNPKDYPGYYDLMNTPQGRKIVENFHLKRNKILSKEYPDYEVL